MGIKLTDNAATTLASAIGTTDTLLTVAAGKGNNFPALAGGTGDYFVVTMQNAAGVTEFIQVTYRPTGVDTFGNATYPCVRGYWNSTPQSWNVGDIVDIRPSAMLFQLTSNALLPANNLSDVASVSAARSNLQITASNVPMSAVSGFTATDVQTMMSQISTQFAGLPSTYLTQSSASSTYLTQSNAAATYLTQASAASTYLTQSAAASTYVTPGQLQVQYDTAFAAGGTAPNFTLTPAPAIGAYTANQRFRVAFGAAGTTGSNTLNISGLGAKNLKQYDSTGTKQPAVIAANMLADVEYDGTDMVVLDPLPPVVAITGTLISEVVVTATGAYSVTVPAGATMCEARIVGGGGGGAGYSGGGGGGGGYCENIFAVTVGATITGNVGAGGTGIVNLTAGSGGATTVTSPAMTAAGGGGGTYSGGAGGSGGSASGPGLNIPGQPGANGNNANATSFAGSGGNSKLGQGAPALPGGGTANGIAYGGGACGDTGTVAGGNGANGVAIFKFYK